MSNSDLSQLEVLVNALAHDLKNPLAALMTNLHYVESHLRVLNAGDYADAAKDSLALCDILERYFRNMDLLGRARLYRPRPEAISPKEIVMHGVSRLQRTADGLGVRVTIGELEDMTPWVVDRDMFVRLMENVLANAIEHAPKDTVVNIQVASSTGNLVVTRRRTKIQPTFSLKVPESGKVDASLGRGLSCYAAMVAARLCGVTISVHESADFCTIELIASGTA